MTASIIWLTIALVFIVTEIFTQTVWGLCLAVGAFCALGSALLGAPPVWQGVVLAVCSAAACLLLMPLVKRWRARQHERHGHADRTGMEALLGRRATVTEEVHAGGMGRARIDGDYWQVTAPSEPYGIPVGAEVIVTGYDSIILTVVLPVK